MAMSEQALPALVDTQHAFDGVAATYDWSNERNPILRAMRRRTIDALERHVQAPARVVDLGCGPGADAERLARDGFDVTAIDWSPAMVEEAQRRVREGQLRDRVEIRQIGIHELHRLEPAQYDAALSNFGPLNCVPSLQESASLIAARLKPGGILAASVIGRVCPWEMALYFSRGDRRRARVRFARDFVPVPLEGRIVWTRYYSPREFESAFVPAGFRRVSLHALGLCVPPPYMQAFAARHPRLIARLQSVDDVAGGWPMLRGWGDHFLIVMRRV